jgi:hypothetical protein
MADGSYLSLISKIFPLKNWVGGAGDIYNVLIKLELLEIILEVK